MSPLQLVAKVLSYGSRARTSLFIAALALLLFAVPGQTLELYVIYAQGMAGFASAIGDGQSLGESADLWLVVQLAWGILATVLLSLLLGAATVRVLATTDQAPEPPVLIPRSRHELTAVGIGMVPVLAVLIGFWRALTTLGIGEKGAPALLAETGWLIFAGSILIGLVLLGTAFYAVFVRPRALPLIHAFFSWRCMLGVLAAMTVAIIALVWRPVDIPATIGTPAIAATFLGALCYLLTVCTCVTATYRIPVVTPLLLLAVVFAFADLNDNHRAQHSVRETPHPQIESEFLAWYAARKDRAQFEARGQPYPIYIVSAEGGGLYAGYHAASFLARMQDECPAFAHHTFGISSVSGGSLGAAVFSLAAGRTTKEIGIKPCAPIGPEGANSRLVRRFFANDFLSPLIAAALFPDFLQRFLPFPIGAFDRARALESAFIDAWQDAVDELPGRQSAVNELERPIAEIGARGTDSVPLFLNTTAVATGARVTFSPFHFEATPTAFHLESSLGAAVDVPLATAVSLSARFPVVTPVGWLERPPPRTAQDGTVIVAKSAYGNRLYLADGGYFENSGLETAIELSTRLRRVIEKHPEVFPNGLASAEIKIVKIMAGDPYAVRWWSQDADMSHSSPGEILSPLAVLLNTRRARTRSVDSRTMFDQSLYRYSEMYRDPKFAEFAVSESGRMGFIPGQYRVMLDGTSYFLPLGWHLSATTRRNIERHDHYISLFSRCMIRQDLTPTGKQMGALVRACSAETSGATAGRL